MRVDLVSETNTEKLLLDALMHLDRVLVYMKPKCPMESIIKHDADNFLKKASKAVISGHLEVQGKKDKQ